LSSRNNIRAAVHCGGKPRCILSVKERTNGDLLLDIKGRQLAHPTGLPFVRPDQWRGDPIREYRYSVHMSPASTTGINTIKLHHILRNGKAITGVQYTAAIKQTNNFSPIYARQCSALSDAYYDIKTDELFDLVDKFDSDAFVLVFGVFIASSGRTFLSHLSADIALQQITLKEFSILLMRSFLTVPSHDASSFEHCVTKPGEGQTRGHDENACFAIFRDARSRLRERFIERLNGEPEMAPAMPILRASEYVRAADKTTVEYRAWLRSLKAQGLV
jgi:hypothetical protein